MSCSNCEQSRNWGFDFCPNCGENLKVISKDIKKEPCEESAEQKEIQVETTETIKNMDLSKEEACNFKKRKSIKKISILAFVFAIVGYLLIESIDICQLSLSFVSLSINLLNKSNLSWLPVVINLLPQIVTMIVRWLALAPCIIGFVFGIISLKETKKTKDRLSTIFGAISMSVATITIISVLKYFIYLIAAILVVLLSMLVSFGAFLYLFPKIF